MNAVAKAEHLYDRRTPEDMGAFLRPDEIEFNKEQHTSRFPTTYAADQQVERFIAELVAAPNKDLFLEKNAGTFPRSASNEFELHLSVAEQWIKNKEAVGELVGPVFFRWAKNLTYTAMRFGWYPAAVNGGAA